MKSQKSPRYGSLAEKRARERYDLGVPEGGRVAWMDAKRGNGDPVEIKAAAVRRSDGSEGRFRVFERPHRQLARHDGWYVFVAYSPRGNGIRVEDMTMTRARAVRLSWGPSGHSTDGRSRQSKIPISSVF